MFHNFLKLGNKASEHVAVVKGLCKYVLSTNNTGGFSQFFVSFS